MENKYFYPALFHKQEGGGFWISFPDIPECLTQGEDMAKAYEMAVDALGLALEDRIKEDDIPQATSIDMLVVEEGSYPVIIEFDLLAYRRKYSSKAVKKTLSIPEWLNDEAMKKGINFSAVLQDALKAQLGIA
ncbi:MAG: type II toxin-antitoxin system HicB family antitoxin [Firmicutes bacterium]|nr:type II toxin-antitoxin system HicB family antitoxin [Bacillota bacterium]